MVSASGGEKYRAEEMCLRGASTQETELPHLNLAMETDWMEGQDVKLTRKALMTPRA